MLFLQITILFQVMVLPIVPPSWLVKPVDMEAVVDQFVEIRCTAEGSPKPSILWKKEIGKLCFQDR